jgi:outer membrane receptor protein involved in Fe transport
VPLTDQPDGVTQFRNVGRASLRGLDLGVEQRLPGAWLWRASVSWMDARNDAGERLSNAPRWMLKGHVVSPRWQGWQLGAEGQVIGPRLGRVNVPTAFHLNVHLRREIDEQHSVALHVNNLFDRRNLDPATPDTRLDAIPQPGRAWRLDWRILF